MHKPLSTDFSFLGEENIRNSLCNQKTVIKVIILLLLKSYFGELKHLLEMFMNNKIFPFSAPFHVSSITVVLNTSSFLA